MSDFQSSLPTQRGTDAGPQDAVLVPLLISMAKATRQLLSIKLAAIGVLAGQDQLLCVLDENQPRNIVGIAGALSVRPSTVSKMLDIFAEKDWAVREADPSDKRKAFARLTPEGGRVQASVRQVWSELDGELMGGLGGDGSGASDLASLRDIDTVLSRRLSRLR